MTIEILILALCCFLPFFFIYTMTIEKKPTDDLIELNKKYLYYTEVQKPRTAGILLIIFPLIAMEIVSGIIYFEKIGMVMFLYTIPTLAGLIFMIKYKCTIDKGHYFIYKDIIKEKQTESNYDIFCDTYNTHYYLYLKDYYKKYKIAKSVGGDIFGKCTEDEEVYILLNKKGDIIDIYDAKRYTIGEDIKNKVISCEKMEEIFKISKYEEDEINENKKHILTKKYLNKMIFNQYKKSIKINGFLSLFTLAVFVPTLLFIIQNNSSEVMIFEIFVTITLILIVSLFIYYLAKVILSINANKNNKLIIKKEKINKIIEPKKYHDIHTKFGIQTENMDEPQDVLIEYIGKVKENDSVYTFYHNNDYIFMINPKVVEISKEFNLKQ